MSFDPKDSIFKVTGIKDGVFGTCFIIQKDDSNTYFLTCEHVIENIGGAAGIMIRGSKAEVVASNPSSEFDIAILKVEEVFSAPAFKLTPPRNLRTVRTLKGFGYYQPGKQVLFQRFTCDIIQEKETYVTSADNHEKAWWFSTSVADKLHEGFSGSPVFDDNHCALGFINQRKRNGEYGFAISIGAVQHIWPALAFPQSTSQGIQNRIDKERDDRTLINFTEEIEVLKNILGNRDHNTRLIALEGKSYMGKSRLIREYLSMIDSRETPIVFFDLKVDYVNIEQILDRITSELGDKHFGNYSEFFEDKPMNLTRYQEKEWYQKLNRKFYLDLHQAPIERLCFVIFDHFEKADKDLREWLSQHFLERNSKKSPFITIVGGQEVPKMSYEESHRSFFKIDKITLKSYKKYVKEKNIPIEDENLEFLYDASKGLTGILADYILNLK